MTSAPGGPVSANEIRALLDEARAAVRALRDAAVVGGDPAEQLWFEKWRREGVTVWNRLSGYLAAGDQEMVFGELQEIRSLGRAILENADWRRVAPGSVDPHTAFVDHLQQVWGRLPAEGTPEAADLGRRLAAMGSEFPPLA